MLAIYYLHDVYMYIDKCRIEDYHIGTVYHSYPIQSNQSFNCGGISVRFYFFRFHLFFYLRPFLQ